MTNDPGANDAELKPVASYRHSLIFLGIVAAVAFAGYMAQHRQVGGTGLVETHANVIPIYTSVALLDWLLVLFVWRGIRQRGGSCGSLIKGRWSNGREILRDLCLAAGFWGILLAAFWAMDHLLGQGQEKSVDILLPRSALEAGVWVATSVSAGFCEEFVFRGYVQSQLRALSRSTAIAVLGQALIFGVMHAYQGWRLVAQICVAGILFGALAAWRKTLRIGMMAHGWQDIWSGWLSALIMR